MQKNYKLVSQTTPTTLQSTAQTDMSTIDSSNQHASTTFMVTPSSSRETIITDLSSILSEVTTPTPIQSTSTDLKTTTTPTPIQSTSTDMKTTTTKLLTTEQSALTSTPQVCSPTSPDYCECVADGMWTVIQRRFDGSVDFYRTWTEYKDGFGDENGEFWLGNEALHQMTSSTNYMLKVNLTNWDNITKYAVYDIFRIADEADGYRLTIGGYCGDAGDSMTGDHNRQMFSTKDRDNDMWDNHCAQARQGGWWYQFCGDANLNGVYYHDNNNVRGWGINWFKWPNFEGNSLKETTMMIKEVP